MMLLRLLKCWPGLAGTRLLPYLALLFIGFSLTSCERFPRHYTKLNQCLIENGSVGKEHLVAYAELEDWLIAEDLLGAPDKSSYKSLLNDVALGRLQIRAYDAAPEVRDFWALQEGGSFGAFFSCTEKLHSELSETQAASVHAMHEIFVQMRSGGNVRYGDAELLSALVEEGITDEDFEFVLYRAALLNLLVFMME